MRVAIVGAGLMGGWHARYAARYGALIAAIVDADPRAAEALGGRFPRAQAFRSLQDGLRSVSVDVVHVCTGLASHAALAEEALDAGKHVLVEKPAGRSVAEVTRLVELAKRKQLKLAAVHQFRFQRGFQQVVRDLAALGDLTRIAYTTCSAGGEGRSAGERRAILLEILPHPVALLRAILGAGMDTGSWRVLSFTDDNVELASLRGKTRLSVEVSLRALPTRNELVITGTRATALVDLFHGFAIVEGGPASRLTKALAPFRHGGLLIAAAGVNLIRRTLEREPAYPGLRELIRRFYASVRDGTPSPVSGEEMLEAVALIERVGGERAAALHAHLCDDKNPGA